MENQTRSKELQRAIESIMLDASDNGFNITEANAIEFVELVEDENGALFDVWRLLPPGIDIVILSRMIDTVNAAYIMGMKHAGKAS